MKKIKAMIAAGMILVILSGCQKAPDPEQTPSEAVSAEAVSQTEADAQAKEDIQTEESPAAEEKIQTEANAQTEEDLSAEENPEDEQNIGFTDLGLKVSEGELRICSGESFSLTDHAGNPLNYEISENTLYVKTDHKEDAVLVLPETVSYGTVKLTVQNGHVYGEGAVTVDRLDVRVTQGEVSLEDMTVLENSSIQIDGGSASVHGDPGMTVTADCRKGHLNFLVPFEETEGNYEIKASGGNIRLGSQHYSGKSVSHTVDNQGERSVTLSCTHGDLSMEFEQ